MGHFLLSMVLLADAVVLFERAREPDPPVVRRPVVDAVTRRVGSLLVAAAALVIVLGTVVTGAGPHGGDEHVERLTVSVHRAAQVHGGAVVLLLGLTLFAAWLIRRAGNPAGPSASVRAFLLVLAMQAAIGYVQYFSGVPVLLVGFHIAGAAAVWVTVLRLRLSLHEVVPEAARMSGWAASSRPLASPPPRSASPRPTRS
jgi:cytochrome c oxidase assembly protein subunit 15